MSNLQRKTPMNPGKGFQHRGRGFQRHQDSTTVALSEEVGEGQGSSFGYSKHKQARGAAFVDEVGEGVALPFGKHKQARGHAPSDEVGEGVVLAFDKRKQARGEAFQDETGEGITRAFSKRTKRIQADYNAERARKIPTLADPSRFKWGEEVGEGITAQPKTVALRNPAILEMARGRPCLLQAPYTMSHDPATTVGCHGNGHQFGKGDRRKADDCYVVWGCFECHSWLDQGSASQHEKLRVFHLGMFRQMLAWEQVAASEHESQRFKRAAEWALDNLQALEYDPRAALLELEGQEQNAPALEIDQKTGAYMPVTRI